LYVLIVPLTHFAAILHEWDFGLLDRSMTHLYLFLAELALESALAVHHPVVPTLNTENPILYHPFQLT
jgi:hypothetical protein